MTKPDFTYQKRNGSASLLLGAVLAFGVAVLVVLFWLITQKYLGAEEGQETYVWLLFLLGCILWAPSMYLAWKRDFNPFHPLVFPVWTHLFPAYVLGGLMIPNLDLYSSWIFALIPDPEFYLPLSVIYIIIGFAGLVFGFALPFGGGVGRKLSRYVPSWRWEANRLLTAAMFLILFGMVAYIYAYNEGAVGYQVGESPTLFANLAFSLSMVGDLGAFLLWWAFWEWRWQRQQGIPSPRKTHVISWTPAFLLWGGRVVLTLLFSGSRASLFAVMLQVMGAYCVAERKFSKRAVVGLGLAITIAVLIGFSWGTIYREVKGSESRASIAEGLEIASDALSEAGSRGLVDNMIYALANLLARIEAISSFAVIVSNYQGLHPIEEQYGIANNIWTYTWTAFIPRFAWPNKPLVSDARTIAEIYFDFPDNSFAMTVFGDLLRNFGPLGIPVGMALLGFLLRLLYTVGLEEGRKSAWRNAAYFILLTAVNYESFFGTILPGWLRLGLVLTIAGCVINFIIRHPPARTSDYQRTLY